MFRPEYDVLGDQAGCSHSPPLTSLSVLYSVSDSKFPTTLPRQYNLSKPEKSALRSLRTNPTSVLSLPIRATLLSSSTGMVTLRRWTVTCPIDPPTNPTQSYNQDLHRLISTAAISKTRYLITLQHPAQHPYLYLLPKMHKPGNLRSLNDRVSAYIDAHIQPFVKSLLFHVQDTNIF